MSIINPHYILRGKPSKYKDQSEIVRAAAHGEITIRGAALMMGVTQQDVRDFIKIYELGYGKLRKKNKISVITKRKIYKVVEDKLNKTTTTLFATQSEALIYFNKRKKINKKTTHHLMTLAKFKNGKWIMIKHN